MSFEGLCANCLERQRVITIKVPLRVHEYDRIADEANDRGVTVPTLITGWLRSWVLHDHGGRP